MMLYLAALFHLALLAYATPPNAKLLTPELAAQVASFPVVELNTTSPFVAAALASHGSVLGPQPDATFFPASLLMCAAVSCTDCTSFDLSTLPADECFGTAVTTLSVAIVQPSNIGLQTSVVVGTPGCIQFLQVTTVNTCFNLNTPTLLIDDFALIVVGRTGAPPTTS